MTLEYTLADLNAFYTHVGASFRGHDITGIYEVLEELMHTHPTIEDVTRTYISEYTNKDTQLVVDVLSAFVDFLSNRNTQLEEHDFT